MPEESATENELMGKKGRYIMSQRPFAFGSTSILWQAKDNQDEIVCVKSFQREYGVSKQNLNEFMNELIARQAISHPNILPIIDHGYDDRIQGNSSPFIVLPFCHGGNLREIMRGRDFVSPQIFFPILKQIALAVDFAHANGIIHGDIKPENILFQDEERQQAWLADFGIAIFFPVSEEIITKAGPGAGSTAYLSPEQIGENRQSPASDIYSLAMVAYEALTGQLPFDISAPPFMQMYEKVNGNLTHPLQANGRLAQSISDGLLAGLRVDPRQRPKTGIEFYELLRENQSKYSQSSTQKSDETAREFDRQDLLKFYKILSQRFNKSELQSLCFELGIDYDKLPGSNTDDKSRELITYLTRRNLLMKLITTGSTIRPDIDWT